MTACILIDGSIGKHETELEFRDCFAEHIEKGKSYIETVPKPGYRFSAQVRELQGAGEDLIVHNRVRARIVTEEVAPDIPVPEKGQEWKHAKQIEAAPERLADRIRQHRTSALVGVALLLITVAGVVFSLYRFVSHKSTKNDLVFQTMRIST